MARHFPARRFGHGLLLCGLTLGCATKSREFDSDSGIRLVGEDAAPGEAPGGGRDQDARAPSDDDVPVAMRDSGDEPREPSPEPVPSLEPSSDADAGDPIGLAEDDDATSSDAPDAGRDAGPRPNPSIDSSVSDSGSPTPSEPGEGGAPTNGDGCLTGATRPCSEMGALGNCAAGFEECVLGAWSGNCSIAPSANDSCDLGDDADCDGIQNEGCPCIAGAERSCAAGGALGNCASGTQTCGDDGSFGPCSVQPQSSDACNDSGDDADCDGVPNGGCTCLDGDSDECGPTTDLGPCQKGTVACSNGQWSTTCVGAVYPEARNCTSSADANCDGVADNTLDATCQCVAGSVEVCGAHPGYDQFPQCSAGQRTCNASAAGSSTSWGPRVGSVGPASADSCDPGDDSNCNGIPNEGCRVVCSGDYLVTTATEFSQFVALQCQELTGSLSIDGLSRSNLNGLVIEEIGGDLFIWDTTVQNLTGLGLLTSVGGGVYIDSNDSLQNLDALASLERIGDGLYIETNDALTDLTGLAELVSLDGNLRVLGNLVSTLEGLEGLTTISGNVWINSNSLTSLEGLNNVQTINGYLLIDGSDLTSLTALSNLDTIGAYLHVQNATQLTSLAGLGGIQSIGTDLYLYYLDSLTSLSPLTSWSANTLDNGLYLGFLPNVCQSAVTALDAQLNASCAYCQNNGAC
jgi:hypothetical protein